MLKKIFYGLAIFLSQFYIFESGTLQPAHLLLLLAFVLSFISSRGRIATAVNPGPLTALIGLALYVAVVNLLFSLIWQNLEFNLATIYLAYGVLIYMFIGHELRRDFSFSKNVANSLMAGVVFLALANLAGFGEHRFEPRYNGFFNDPNQMAFWVLCAYSTYSLLTSDGLKRRVAFFLTAAYVIFTSMSRSALLGLILIAIGMVITLFAHRRPERGASNSILYGVFGVIGLSVLAVTMYALVDGVVLESFARFADADFEEQADVRGYGRIAEFPEYLILGAGQGLNIRFGAENEIHSTWAGLFFYYGFPGLTLFLVFVVILGKRISFGNKFFLLGPLVYGFSTFGFRTPVFWIFLTSAAFVASAVPKR